MVEEVFKKSFWINPSHIPTHYKAHTFLRCIWKHVDFLIFNHKFPFNTKINDLENNKVKPTFNDEMVLTNGLWSGRIWINVMNDERKGGCKCDNPETQHDCNIPKAEPNCKCKYKCT